MNDYSDLMKIFVQKIKNYIGDYEKKLVEVTKMREMVSYLRQLGFYRTDKLLSIIDIDPEKICEMYSVFEPKAEPLSLQEVENVISICKIVQDNPHFRTMQRYIDAEEFLKKIQRVFNSRFMGKSYNTEINEYQKLVKKYQDLIDFIEGNNSEFVIGDFDNYKFSQANLSDEEWASIFSELNWLQIQSFMALEEKTLSNLRTQLEENIQFNANLITMDFENELSEEPDKKITEDTEQLIIDPVESIVVPVSPASKIEPSKRFGDYEFSEEITEKYKTAKEMLSKFYEYKCRSTKEFEIKKYHTGNYSLDSVKEFLSSADFKIFLYYGILIKLQEAEDILDFTCSESQLDEYMELFFEEVTAALGYAWQLTQILEQEKNEVQQPSILSDGSIGEHCNTIIFHKNGEHFEIEKQIKKLNKDNVREVLSLIEKMETGHFENAHTLSFNIPVNLSFIRSTNFNIVFRQIDDSHVFVYGVFPLSDMDKARGFENLSITPEDMVRYSELCRDKSLDYRKMISENREFMKNLKELDKGVAHDG
ncbi:MAG: hypothetical protein IJ475_03800 [Bacilli bacterium]|nr:hypothetical protein [Bacilli bacterium]